MPSCALAQRRRVVRPVAAHANRVALALKRLDQLKLLFRINSGVYGKIIGTDAVGDLSAGSKPVPLDQSHAQPSPRWRRRRQ